MIVKNKYSRKIARGVEFKTSEDGMSNVITVVFIIAIIVGFILGPILTIVIPEQIRNNESAHMDDIKESFFDLRSSINSELYEDTRSHTTRLKLGTDNENPLVVGGTGVLYFNPTEPLISISSSYDSRNVYARGSGNIQYTSRNIYLPDKTWVYESTGVIVSQRGVSNMNVEPNFEVTRRYVVRTLLIDIDFGYLTASDKRLTNIYLINTDSLNVTFNKAQITWLGGNATAVTSLNIAGSTLEWTGNAASGTTFNFQNPYKVFTGSVPLNILFNEDMRNSVITIELYTNTSQVLTDAWPSGDYDTNAHVYDISFPDPATVNSIKFTNICTRQVTVDKIGLTWTGDAKLERIEIPGHGEEVWNETSGATSPLFADLVNLSVFNPNEMSNVEFYFDDDIQSYELNVKFFAENSSNSPTIKYPIEINQTFLNASFTAVTLVCDNINTGGKSSKIIKTTLISSEENRFIWEDRESIVFNITSKYSEAWLNYLNKTLVREANLIWDYDGIGAFEGDYYISSQVIDEKTTIRLILNSVYKLDAVIGVIEVELS